MNEWRNTGSLYDLPEKSSSSPSSSGEDERPINDFIQSQGLEHRQTESCDAV